MSLRSLHLPQRGRIHEEIPFAALDAGDQRLRSGLASRCGDPRRDGTRLNLFFARDETVHRASIAAGTTIQQRPQPRFYRTVVPHGKRKRAPRFHPFRRSGHRARHRYAAPDPWPRSDRAAQSLAAGGPDRHQPHQRPECQYHRRSCQPSHHQQGATPGRMFCGPECQQP